MQAIEPGERDKPFARLVAVYVSGEAGCEMTGRRRTVMATTGSQQCHPGERPCTVVRSSSDWQSRP